MSSLCEFLYTSAPYDWYASMLCAKDAFRASPVADKLFHALKKNGKAEDCRQALYCRFWVWVWDSGLAYDSHTQDDALTCFPGASVDRSDKL